MLALQPCPTRMLSFLLLSGVVPTKPMVGVETVTPQTGRVTFPTPDPAGDPTAPLPDNVAVGENVSVKEAPGLCLTSYSVPEHVPPFDEGGEPVGTSVSPSKPLLHEPLPTSLAADVADVLQPMEHVFATITVCGGGSVAAVCPLAGVHVRVMVTLPFVMTLAEVGTVFPLLSCLVPQPTNKGWPFRSE